jgi:hypothetical protein
MKQKDMILIIVVVFVSGVVSLLISNKLFAAPASRQEKVEVVEAIVADFVTPDKDDKYFNKEAFNLTQIIKIGENNNNQPFKNKP